MKKRIISCILSLLVLVSVLPASAFAKDCTIYRQTYVNPIYRDVVSKADILSAVKVRTYADSQPELAANEQEAAAILRQGMEARKAQITIRFKTKDLVPNAEVFERIGEMVFDETGVPTQGDYIRWSYAGWSAKLDLVYLDDGSYFDLVYDCAYYTTAAQEAELTQKINTVRAGFGFTDSTSDYDIICTIYDYVCSNVTYDYDNLNDDSYMLKYTAYAAMVNGTSVCQGYAVLMYRLLMQENISCRLIAGGNHAWNIVAIDGTYYNIDSTWDSGSSPRYYRYFLRGESDFAGHTRYADYSTEEFYNQYPMAERGYVVCDNHSFGEWKMKQQPTCIENGSEIRSCAVCSKIETRELAALGHDRVHHDGKAATCTEAGWKAYDTCKRCDYTTYEEIAATGHHYTDVVTAPTCTEQGYTTHTCICGKSYVDSYVDATGHNYEKGVCTACGEKDPNYIAAPTLKITTSAGKPKISWNKIDGATKYNIYRSTDGENYKYLTYTTKTSYTNSKATIGTTYYYKITAVIGGTESDFSNIKSIKCVPATPTLTISRVNGKPKLSWKAVTGATKYYIYRSTDGKTYKYYASTTKTSYTNTNVKVGTKYYYKVKAVAVVNKVNVGSAYSAAKSLLVSTAAPTVKITTSNGDPKISWSKVTGATKYYIYRSTDGKTYKYYTYTTKTAYTDTKAKAGTKYYYKVKAIAVVNKTNVASVYSNAVSVKAK